MSYSPPEDVWNTTWPTRNALWRRIGEPRKSDILDLPARCRKLTLDHLPDTKAGDLVKSWCERWGRFPHSGLPTAGLEGDNRGTGLWLWGTPGVGKTTMSAIAVKHISNLGWSSRFIRAADYVAYSKLAMSAPDNATREAYETAFACYAAGWGGWRCVAVDDLGKEYRPVRNDGRASWGEALFENLFRARFMDAAPSIVTTNLTPDEIATEYGEPMGDFIKEAFWLVRVEGRSRRGR